MLPAAAAFRLPWEISRGAVKDGEALRTVGRSVLFASFYTCPLWILFRQEVSKILTNGTVLH